MTTPTNGSNGSAHTSTEVQASNTVLVIRESADRQFHTADLARRLISMMRIANSGSLNKKRPPLAFSGKIGNQLVLAIVFLTPKNGEENFYPKAFGQEISDQIAKGQLQPVTTHLVFSDQGSVTVEFKNETDPVLSKANIATMIAMARYMRRAKIDGLNLTMGQSKPGQRYTYRTQQFLSGHVVKIKSVYQIDLNTTAQKVEVDKVDQTVNLGALPSGGQQVSQTAPAGYGQPQPTRN